MNTRKSVETSAERMVYVNVMNEEQEVDFQTKNLGVQRQKLKHGKWHAKEVLIGGEWTLKVQRFK